jgi:prepilin-type N-terminal cleavage/methylation domain-containing protein
MERAPVLIHHGRGRERGFTLIELLVTMTVTVIALAGLFGVFSVTSRGNVDARQSAEALALCQASADELKSFTVQQIENAPTDTPPGLGYGAIISGTPWGPVAYHEGAVVGASGVTFDRSVYARWIDDDLVWMKVTVAWTSDGATAGSEGGIHDHAVSLEMLRSRTEAPPTP